MTKRLSRQSTPLESTGAQESAFYLTPSPTPQRPLNSGFGFESTAANVLRGVDLTGKLAVVTGGYSGIGLEQSRALAAAGATVVIPARRPAEAAKRVTDIERVEIDDLDLTDFDSVAAFAARFLATGRNIDILINGAGVMAAPETRVKSGWESQFATNHLGHYALTNLLWPALQAAGDARVVTTSSRLHKICDIRWDDLQWVHGYDEWLAYAQSKTANALFALHLDALGAEFGVRAFSLSPGAIRTNLQRYISAEEEINLGWKDQAGKDLTQWKTPEQGAATAVWGATSPMLAHKGGVYLDTCDIAEIEADPTKGGVHPHATNPASAARLWEISAQLTGVNAFAAA
jgi:NAD(P)-dependent dehydrogenase (short-subunit alcohol dehydrogenase family)